MKIHIAVGPLAFLGAASLLWGADPFAGVWTLNLAKSKFPTNLPHERKETVTIEERGDARTVTIRGIAGDGKTISRKYNYPGDGGPATYIEGAPPAGASEVRKKIDDRTMDQILTRNGAVIAVSRFTLSRDGKTITVLRNQGQPMEAVAVYEKK